MNWLAQTVDWAAVAPAIAVAVTALVVLLADLWLPVQRAPAVLTGIGVVGVLVALLFVGLLWNDPRATFCVGSGEAGFASCSYVVNQVTLAFQGMRNVPQAWCTVPQPNGHCSPG